MMKFLVVVAILLTLSEGCQLPERLVGEWDSEVAGWTDLVITDTTISSLPADNGAQNFSCLITNGTTYLLQSPLLSVGNLLNYYYYTCLDIVPEGSNPDLVFFYIRTENNGGHGNQPIISLAASKNATLEQVCNKAASDFPNNYELFFKKGYEARLVNQSCPSSLQAEFWANFTGDNPQQQCPDGFDIDGCDQPYIVFNYTQCDGGVTNYTCMTSMKIDDVTYTMIRLQQDGSPTNPFAFSCLAQKQTSDDGVVTITKSPGTCGSTPSVHITANETLSCRSQTPEVTTPGPGSEGNSTPSPSPPTTSNSTQGPGTGGGGQGGGGTGGDGNSCHVVSWGSVSFLLPALITTVLAAAAAGDRL